MKKPQKWTVSDLNILQDHIDSNSDLKDLRRSLPNWGFPSIYSKLSQMSTLTTDSEDKARIVGLMGRLLFQSRITNQINTMGLEGFAHFLATDIVEKERNISAKQYFTEIAYRVLGKEFDGWAYIPGQRDVEKLKKQLILNYEKSNEGVGYFLKLNTPKDIISGFEKTLIYLETGKINHVKQVEGLEECIKQLSITMDPNSAKLLIENANRNVADIANEMELSLGMGRYYKRKSISFLKTKKRKSVLSDHTRYMAQYIKNNSSNRYIKLLVNV